MIEPIEEKAMELEVIEIKPIQDEMILSPTNISLSPKMVQKDMLEAEKAIREARAVIVSTDLEYEQCGEGLKSNKAKLKDLETRRVIKVSPFNEITKIMNGYFKMVKDKHENAIKIRNDVMQAYATKKKQDAEKEQARLKAEAEKQAKILKDKADKAAAKGDEAKAEQLRQEAAMKTNLVPVVETSVPKVAGLTNKTSHWGEVTDFKTFAKYCVETDRFELLEVCQKELDKVATTANGTRTIPGVVFKSGTNLAGCRQ